MRVRGMKKTLLAPICLNIIMSVINITNFDMEK